MTETIQQLKEDIAILQEKLQKLEEQDPEMLLLRQGNIDIVDYDGKKYFRIEYTDSFADAYSWYVRRVGEDAIRPVRDVNVYAPLEELYKKEVVKQKDDYPYNPHKKYTPEETAQSLKETAQSLKEAFVKPQGPQGPVGPGPGPKGVIVGYEPTPQTPEQVADGLKEAFREAVKQGIVSSVDEPTKPMNEVLDRLENKYENDDVVNRMLKKWEENPPDFLKFQLGKSLEDRIYKWWETCFVYHTEWSMEECVEDLLDIITLFLPAEQSHEGTQSASVIDLVDGYNDALTKIKSKLRNKK